MPQNWKTYKLSDFIDINPKLKLHKNEEYSFVEMKDLDPNNRTVLPSDYKVLKGGAKFSNGDIYLRELHLVWKMVKFAK